MTEREEEMSEELYEVFPAIALYQDCVLPGSAVNVDAIRLRDRKAAKMAVLGDSKVFLIAVTHPENPNPGLSDLESIGVIAKIRQVAEQPGENTRLVVEADERARLISFEREFPYLVARVERLPILPSTMDEAERQAYDRAIRDAIGRYVKVAPKLSREQVNNILMQTSLEQMVGRLLEVMPLPMRLKQQLLNCNTQDERTILAYEILIEESQVAQIQVDIQKKTQKAMEKNQREYFLREQMKVIREELGEDGIDSDADRFAKKLGEIEIGPEEKEKVEREIGRFRRLNINSVDAMVMRTYLETLLELPWKHMEKDALDMDAAWELLEKEHYGLKEVKERIMDFLAVRGLTGGSRSPILCLVGPPGTGKTSIAKSIAGALHKKYIRVCLGGVKDEAQIRGHRRTYVGALPGEITSALRQAGCANPLMLLDEIDKTGSDYKGDVSSALLEVLDPEQNARFHDHYVDIPQDLSQVLFLATANDMHSIPRPLLDRMEVVEIPGYTANEKMHIAKEHLIPKQVTENGLPEGALTITDGALMEIISRYTKEAGVRSLERTIGKICRKAARRVMAKDSDGLVVTEKNLGELLGKPKFNYQMANEKDEIGIVRGLAWTQVGGDTLEIEVNVMPGKGELTLTGKLGDVMKESAQAGITYVRSVAESYGIDAGFFKEHDLHVHIPEGAVPKDGPSAGITMATAMLSAVVKKPVRANLAMTGEITLRGRVLPIGGLKEKLLAAKYAHISKVLVPAQNRPDIEEMEQEIVEGLAIVYVETMEDVLREAFAA